MDLLILVSWDEMLVPQMVDKLAVKLVYLMAEQLVLRTDNRMDEK
jgi:hypothetical protein